MIIRLNQGVLEFIDTMDSGVKIEISQSEREMCSQILSGDIGTNKSVLVDTVDRAFCQIVDKFEKTNVIDVQVVVSKLQGFVDAGMGVFW